jgi:DNA transformation protein
VSVSQQYLTFVLDQLSQVRKVTSRRMFGGAGFYAGELFFAIADDDTLYFKVDAASRGDYEREGMKPFQPFGPESKPMSGYYEVPATILEDTDELAAWMNKAVGAAAGSRRKY